MSDCQRCQVALTVLDANVLINETLIGQLGAHRCDPIGTSVDNDQAVNLA